MIHCGNDGAGQSQKATMRSFAPHSSHLCRLQEDGVSGAPRGSQPKSIRIQRGGAGADFCCTPETCIQLPQQRSRAQYKAAYWKKGNAEGAGLFHQGHPLRIRSLPSPRDAIERQTGPTGSLEKSLEPNWSARGLDHRRPAPTPFPCLFPWTAAQIHLTQRQGLGLRPDSSSHVIVLGCG